MRIISSLIIALGMISPLYGAPSSVPSGSSAPLGGYFTTYFQNLQSVNPCITGMGVVGFSSTLVPQCGYLFWAPNAGGELEYTGNVKINGDLIANNIHTNNLTATNPSFNGVATFNDIQVIGNTNLNSGGAGITTINGILNNDTANIGVINTNAITASVDIGTPSLGANSINGVPTINYVTVGGAGSPALTSGRVPKATFLGVNTLTDSNIEDNGMEVRILGGLPLRAGSMDTSSLRISGGSPGAGKVLTSDAIGNASWQTVGGSFPSNLTPQNGYAWIGGGILMQWGKVCPPGGANNTYNYPIPFPNQALQVVGSRDTAHHSATRANFSLELNDNMSFYAGVAGMGGCTNYIAIGY